MSDEFEATGERLGSLRVYLRRGDTAPKRSFWRRLLPTPLARELLHRGLKAGLLYGSLQAGGAGFVSGAKYVADVSNTDGPWDGLPMCLELVGDVSLLARFVEAHAELLAGTTMMLVEGVEILGAGDRRRA